MYQVEAASQVLRALRQRLFRRAAVPGTVIGLGWTSFFTDVSSEMVTSILPVYVFISLQVSPVLFGLIDGLQQGASALVRLIGGYVADKWRRYKETAVVGYALSALSRLGMLLVGSGWGGVAAMVLADRIGKGLRTAPRDAMISLAVDRNTLGTAFGVHRALDTAGALLGPILAFALLALVPGRYDAVFVVSLCFALIGIAVLVLFVRPVRSAAARSAAPRASAEVTPSAVLALMRDPPVRRVAVIAAILSLFTISDGFLYLSIQQRMQLDVGYFPLLFVLTAASYMLLSLPVGRLADRFGPARIFLCGYLALVAVYTVLLRDEIGWPALFGYLFLLGAYYAATDGVLMALASRHLPAALRGSGLAVLGTLVGVARLASSLIFGFVWSQLGIQATVAVFLAFLAGSLMICARYLLRSDRHEPDVA